MWTYCASFTYLNMFNDVQITLYSLYITLFHWKLYLCYWGIMLLKMFLMKLERLLVNWLSSWSVNFFFQFPLIFFFYSFIFVGLYSACFFLQFKIFSNVLCYSCFLHDEITPLVKWLRKNYDVFDWFLMIYEHIANVVLCITTLATFIPPMTFGERMQCVKKCVFTFHLHRFHLPA